MKALSRLIILAPAVLFAFVSPTNAESLEGLNAVGYSIGDGEVLKSDTAYPSCGEDVVPFINVTFDYEQNLFSNCGWDYFMIHYSGYLTIPEHETIEFFIASDDGGVLESEFLSFGNWYDQGCTATLSGNIEVASGSYAVDFFYYERGGGTCFMLAWKIDDGEWTIVPPSAFTRVPVSTTTSTTTTIEETTTTTTTSTTSTTVAPISVTTSSTTTTTSTIPEPPPTFAPPPPVTAPAPLPTEPEPPTTEAEPPATLLEPPVTAETPPKTIPEPPPLTVPEPPTSAPEPVEEPPLTVPEPPTTIPVPETVEELTTFIETLSKDEKIPVEQAVAIIATETFAALSQAQIEEVFSHIEVEEINEEQAMELIASVQEAPLNVRSAFQKVLNVFGGVFDSYVPIGSKIPVGERRTLVAVGAVLISASPTSIKRR